GGLGETVERMAGEMRHAGLRAPLCPLWARKPAVLGDVDDAEGVPYPEQGVAAEGVVGGAADIGDAWVAVRVERGAGLALDGRADDRALAAVVGAVRAVLARLAHPVRAHGPALAAVVGAAHARLAGLAHPVRAHGP